MPEVFLYIFKGILKFKNKIKLKVIFIRSGNNGLDAVSQNQADSLIQLGIHVTYFDIIGNGGWGYLKNIPKLRKVIALEDPDILHAHYALSGIIAALAFSEKPVVVSLMGSDINYASRFFLFVIRIFIYYFWKATIVKTTVMKHRLGIEKVYIVPNGVNLKIFHQIHKSIAVKKLFWNLKSRNILFGSDPVRIEKNYDLFRKSVEKLKPVYQGIEIHYLKGIQRENVYLHYCASDVLVLTSEYEGSPNVIKEAMACNCPIVSTDAGDVKEIISATEGCFITSSDPGDVSQKIKLALEFGRRTTGRDKIKHLSSELVAKKLINIYEGIMDATL
jgi:glycosyltransferase involved in cell wall biosynthesis